jgi:16S rRNA (cytosine1402-N4)-methyltransferase
MDFDQDYKHIPVLVGEVLLSLRPQAQAVYVDATLGEGGHAEALLRASAPSGRLIGIDRDAEVLEIARQRLAPCGSRVNIVHGHAAELKSILEHYRSHRWTAYC